MTVRYDESIGGRFLDRGGAVLNVRHPHFGATGDGAADDTRAFQAAVDAAGAAGGVVLVPPGKYRITEEIVLRDKVALVGAAGFDRSPSAADAWLWWDGPAAPAKAVLRCSKAPVGREPDAALSNVRIRSIVVDGRARAGYGLYAAYCTNDSRFEDVTAVFATRHGMWFGKLWYARLFGLVARRNPGCGITIGARPERWRRSSVVNGLYIADIRAHENGTDGAFHETTNPVWGYGIGFFPGNACILRSALSEKNHGPGVVFGLGGGAVNGIHGLYLESNGEGAVRAGAATRNWGLVVRGAANARGNVIDSVFLGGAVGSEPQSIWLTGEEPAGTLLLRNIAFGQHIRADWANYAFEEYIYHGISDYVEGHAPRSDAKLSPRGASTLYVRAGGSDDRDGRSPDTAFATLARAVAAAAYLSRVTRIDCAGAGLGNETLGLDRFAAGRSLAIDGGGTATAGRVTARAAGCPVSLRNFAAIGAFRAEDCVLPVQLHGLRVSPAGDADAAVAAVRSRVRLERCVIDGSAGGATRRHAVDVRDQAEVVLVETAIEGFPPGRHYRLATGGVVRHDVDAYGAHARFEDGSAFLYTPARIRSSAGCVRFD